MPKLTAQDYARGCLLRIVAQPGRYEQQSWQTVAADTIDVPEGGTAAVECPTTGCVAGTAAMLAGDRGIVNNYDVIRRNGQRFYQIGSVTTEDGRRVGIRQRGQELLEISDEETAWLFDGHRTLPEVVNALVELSESRPLTRKRESEMTADEKQRLRNYRVPPVVKRERMTAPPVTPVPVQVTQRNT